jgi:hypothetical protein
VVLFSCKKEKTINTQDPPTPPPQEPSSTTLLKDVVINHLPSPFYHFEYNTDGQPSFVSYASGFNQYNILYDEGRLIELRNNIIVNKDRLQYFYDPMGKVVGVQYADSNGLVYKRINLTYDGEKLTGLERKIKLAAGFVTDKTFTMSYYADGNLNELTKHFLPISGHPDLTFVDKFEQYDNKVNVDGFSLTHDEFFDHFVFLPEAKLQKNNPGRVTRTGDGDNYKVDYNYTYNNKNRPLIKGGDFVYTSGANTGQHIQLRTEFSYY